MGLRLLALVSVVAVVAQASAIDLTLFVCNMDNRARLDCCCDERVEVEQEHPAVGVDDRCCDIRRLEFDSQNFQVSASGTAAMPHPVVGLGIDAATSEGRCSTPQTRARSPPPRARDLITQNCSFLI